MNTDNLGLQAVIKAIKNNMNDTCIIWWAPSVSSISWNWGCEIKTRFHVARGTPSMDFLFPAGRKRPGKGQYSLKLHL